jgi:hypothetical protein
MNSLWYRLTGLLLMLVVMTTSSGQLLAQTDDVASTTPTTTEAVAAPAPAPTPAVSPYVLEQIPGTEITVGDFVVGPGRVEVVVKPGESVTTEILVTNRIADGKQFELMVEDMSGSADPSQAVVLLGDQNGPYSLRNYITFPAKTFTLNAGQRARIPVKITMPPNAEPGGYYGGVLVSTIQDAGGNEENLVARSPIVARIGTLFFITVPGDTEINGSVTDFAPVPKRMFFTEGPINLGVLFENTGSVHLNPYGEIRVTNFVGDEVGFVEIEPWFVLPRSLRLREMVWDREFLFGRYTFTANINRGYDDFVDTKQFHIWVLPWQIIGGIFFGIFILFILMRLFLRTFEFKRRS